MIEPVKAKRKSSEKAVTPTKSLGHLIPSYRWSNNSCWLDTALEILWHALNRDFKTFAACFTSVMADPSSQHTALHSLFQLLDTRYTMSTGQSSNHTVDVLSEQRDSFSQVLIDVNATQSRNAHDSVSVSFR